MPPDAPPPHDRQHPLSVVELDEPYTFERQLKARVYLITQVDRMTRCIIAYDTPNDRESKRLQALL